MAWGLRLSYAAAAVLIIAAGLLTRVALLALPWGFAKPLGSILWGAMVYCLIRVGWPRVQPPLSAVAATAIAACVEFSQLWHTASLDAFRRTTIGVLLIGRYFSWADILAYVVGIGVVCLVDLAVVTRRMR